MTWEYSEYNLIKQTAIDLFLNKLCCDKPWVTRCFIIQTDERTNRSLRNKILI